MNIIRTSENIQHSIYLLKDYIDLSHLHCIYMLMSDWLVTVMMKFIFHSDTGTKVPESCVFGQLLNMASAICKIVNLYIRINPI